MNRNFIILGLVLAVGLYGISFFGGAALASKTIVRVKHVEKSYGKKSSTVDCAQINPQLQGLTCDIYQTSKSVTIVAHK